MKTKENRKQNQRMNENNRENGSRIQMKMNEKKKLYFNNRILDTPEKNLYLIDKNEVLR